ncbi:MAG: hypothetical protein EOO14_11815, partial [Chitinophagaceae bacterium]
NQFYRNGILDSTASASQQKINNNHSETLGAKVTFAEPLSDKVSLVMEYSYNQNNAVSKRNTYEEASNGKYETYVPQFSNNFDFVAQSHTGTLISRYATKKLQVSLGSGVSSVQLNLLNLDNASKRDYNFLNLTPQSSVAYTIKPNNTVRLNYRGGTLQPNIEQLQPLRNNIDPLNIVLGNPELDVGFRHNVNLSYNNYKLLKQTGIWASLNYNTTTNAIANRTTIDSRGVRTTMPVNVDGNKGWNFWGEWNKGEGSKKLIHTAMLELSGGINNNFINAFSNRTTYANYSIGYGLRYEVEEKWSLHIRPRIGYSQSLSSLNKAAKTSFLTYGGESQGRLKLPGNFELVSDIELNLQQKLSAFNANPNIILWNAELRKTVFKNKSGIISLLARDILDQNRGFNRVINSNFITEDRFQRIGQYVMLKLEWSFNKMGGE